MKKLMTAKNNRKEYLVILLFWMFLFCAMLYISMNIPLTADDFSYSVNRMTLEPLSSLGSVIQSVFYEYQTWMGRIMCFFFAQLSYLSSKQILFRLTFPLVNCLIVYEMFVLLTNRIKMTTNDLPVVCLISCLLYSMNLVVLNQTLFWIIGYYTYVFPLVFLLFPMIYLTNILLNRNNDQFEKYSYLFGLSSFVGSLFVEHYSLFIFVYGCTAWIYAKWKKCTSLKTLYYILAGSFLGLFIIISAPGIQKRLDSGGAIIRLGLKELLYFGYTRFIYTFFSLNQPLMLILSLLMFFYSIKQNNRLGYCLSILLLPMVLSSFILSFDLDFIFSSDAKYFLMFEWSYYHWDRIGLLKMSFVVIYYIIVFVLSSIYISFNKKQPFVFVLLSASILLQAIFILTDKACERTSFISSFLLILLNVYYFEKIFGKREKYIISLFSGMCLVYCLGIYCINFTHQYAIYQKNDKLMRGCSLNEDCQSVLLEEYDYRFVFKSEIDFNDQENWVLNAMRTYYKLDQSVEILAENTSNE